MQMCLFISEFQQMLCKLHRMNRAVGAGGGGAGAMVPPDFDRSVNPISTRGLDYAHHITTCPSRFLGLPEAQMNIGVHLHSLLKIFKPYSSPHIFTKNESQSF